MRNTSGFYGYSIADIYPNMGDMIDTGGATIIDPDEQEALSGVEPEKKVSPAVASGTRSQIWMVLGALVLFILVFGMPSFAKG